MLAISILLVFLLTIGSAFLREVRIAHLLPVDANTLYEAQVMQLCIEDLRNRSILPRELNLK
jgi:hypothetical protein